LETLPSRIAGLESEITRLGEVLADADLYVRRPAAFTEATKALEAAQASLAAAEEQWLALELLREELEGAPEAGKQPIF
jgi:ATP-binding cassette subfamily F protein uup